MPFFGCIICSKGVLEANCKLCCRGVQYQRRKNGALKNFGKLIEKHRITGSEA